LGPKFCRAQLLQEAKEWLETQQFSLHGGLATVQRFQGVYEGISVNRDERIGTWMVTLDLLKAFKQIPIEEGSQKIFNLRSPACDVMPTVMMMGDSNAPGKLNQVV
jgi:hypothetical protein